MRRALWAALAAAGVAAVAGAVAWAAAGDSPVIHACVGQMSGIVRIPAAGAGCRANETALDWNAQGPAGPKGDPGPQGPPGPAGGAADAANVRVVGFLHVTGPQGTIDGEATDKGHEKWIGVFGFDADATVPIATGGSGGTAAGKVELKPITITKRIDKATPKLFQALVTGEHLQVQLDLVRPDGSGGEETFYTVKLDGVLVSRDHQFDDGAADGHALEEISFVYQKIEISEGGGTAGGGGPTG